MSWHFPLWFLNLLGCQLYQLYYKPIERVKATVPHYVHPGKFKSLWDKTKKSSTSYVFMGSQCHFCQVSCLSKNRRIIVSHRHSWGYSVMQTSVGGPTCPWDLWIYDHTWSWPIDICILILLIPKCICFYLQT